MYTVPSSLDGVISLCFILVYNVDYDFSMKLKICMKMQEIWIFLRTYTPSHTQTDAHITQIPANPHTHTDEIRSQYCCRQPYFPFSSPSSTKLFERVEVRGAFIFICYSFSPSRSFAVNGTIRRFYSTTRIHKSRCVIPYNSIQYTQKRKEHTIRRSERTLALRLLPFAGICLKEQLRGWKESEKARTRERGACALRKSISYLYRSWIMLVIIQPLLNPCHSSCILLWHVCVLSVIKHAHIIIVSHVALSHMVAYYANGSPMRYKFIQCIHYTQW